MKESCKIYKIKQPLIVSLLVGFILSFINQSYCLINMNIHYDDAVRIVMNFIVPFTVSYVSRALLANELKQKGVDINELLYKK